jgi:hypothetical protein
VVDSPERTRDLDREALRVGHRDHAHVDSRDVGVRQVAASIAARHLANAIGDGKLDRLVREANRLAVCVHDLEVAGRTAELGPGSRKA